MFWVICLLLFFMGVDYGLVMPSLLLFMQSLSESVPSYAVGLGVGLFALGGLMMTPLGAFWMDRRSLREVLVAHSWITISGNLLYALSPNIYCIFAARFLCGAVSFLLAGQVFIIRTTQSSPENRAAKFGLMSSLMVLGMIVGPLLSLPLSYLPRAQLGPIEFSSLNAPGFIMASLFLSMQMVIFVFFQEPPPIEAQSPDSPVSISYWTQLKRDLASRKAFVILAQFSALLVQTAVEAVITPVTVAFFGFTQFQNGLIYGGLTVELVALFFALSFFLARVQDRFWVLCGWFMGFVGSVMLLSFEEVAVASGSHLELWQFLFGLGIMAASFPFFESSVGSLYSKLDKSHQVGQTQSVLSLAQGLSTVIGPFVGGALYTLSFSTFIIALCSISSFGFLVFALGYKSLYIEPTALEPQEIKKLLDSESE